ncbi:MAG: peptide-methionine (R)-S-oxide reductase [Flavobacteriales bacterium]|jgi:peptide-methionine (R)-S-oxide reductase
MKRIIWILLAAVLFSCNAKAQKNSKQKEEFPVQKTDAQWEAELSKMQYYILREAGTERPFTSPLNSKYEKGIYYCAACDTPLFNGDNKFDSGSGWPSFDREIKGNVTFDVDYNLGYARAEEHCATCGGHLGHVFNDGPKKTTGKRHCINGGALTFKPIK